MVIRTTTSAKVIERQSLVMIRAIQIRAIAITILLVIAITILGTANHAFMIALVNIRTIVLVIARHTIISILRRTKTKSTVVLVHVND
jgi:hypothetical protein